MNNTFLVITSIASQEHPIVKTIAADATEQGIPFIMVGDTKSPEAFALRGCDFYSIERQEALPFTLAKMLPTGHYARKNLGYLAAMAQGAETIIETDDDNIPLPAFWQQRTREAQARTVSHQGWVNIYRYFTDAPVWPRGFALEHIQDAVSGSTVPATVSTPVQQGLANENPDVDAIYRLTLPLPLDFDVRESVALGNGAFCPFNSQNTTWFKEAFLLMYLPSYCSFRMTDIWRSFVAQRIAWTCGWSVLFHSATVWQERNDHNLMKDFADEVVGYTNNNAIYEALRDLKLKTGEANIPENLLACYQVFIDMNLMDKKELDLIRAWIADVLLLTKK
ncbi:hypothetical protein AGMMS4957_13960 [Bacteroidia bacterium]|nr:hypothetical protein AGMMS4957_13960 [Bacteroidia bacterium]